MHMGVNFSSVLPVYSDKMKQVLKFKKCIYLSIDIFMRIFCSTIITSETSLMLIY